MEGVVASSVRTPTIEERSSSGSRVHLYLAVGTAYFLYISVGTVISWPSPVIPRMNLTENQKSLISSLYSLGAAPGPIIIALGIDSIGRKGTLYLVWSAFVISWTLIWSSEDVNIIYLARVLGGIGVGGTFCGIGVYIVEIAEEKIRGPLGSLNQVFISIGFLVVYCMGPFTSYFFLAGTSFALTLLFGAMFFFVPETPNYLIAKGRNKDAFLVIKCLRGNPPDVVVHAEILKIEEQLTREKTEKVRGFRKLLTSCAIHKGLAICFLLLILQQGSGINGTLAYIEVIFKTADLNISESIVPILVGLTNLISSLPVPILVRKFGTKMVLIASAFGMGLCLCLLGLFFFLKNGGYYSSYLGILPVMSIILYNTCFCIGLGPLVWALVADIFPPSVKGIATCICGVFSCVFGFVAIEAFTRSFDSLGPGPTFVGFGCFLLMGTVGVIFFIPDTSKMSLKEIQDYLEGNSKVNPA